MFSITFVHRSSIFLKLLRFLFPCLKRHLVPRWPAKCLLGSRSPQNRLRTGRPKKKPVNSAFTVRHSLFFSPVFPPPESRILNPATYYPSLSHSGCQETGSLFRRAPGRTRTRWPHGWDRAGRVPHSRDWSFAGVRPADSQRGVILGPGFLRRPGQACTQKPVRAAPVRLWALHPVALEFPPAGVYKEVRHSATRL